MQAKTYTSRDSDRELRLSISFDRADLQLEYSLIGVVPRLADCPISGEPGGPALPRRVLRVALPPTAKVVDIRAEIRKSERISDEVLPIAPQQLSSPGMPPPEQKPYRRPEEDQIPNLDSQTDPRRQKRFVEPLPNPTFVLPNPELYAEATRRPVAHLIDTVVEGLTPVAVINLNPVRLMADGYLEFSSELDLVINYERTEDNRQNAPANVSSRAQAMRQVALTRRSVLNPAHVIDFSEIYPLFPLNTDYLIITDNQQWEPSTMTPLGSTGGDMVASFERLAAWKRQRGLRARVVTIRNILARRYGDFQTGSRDLQEVIRNFLKVAHSDWGVAWVLLGGDANIVPVRQVAGGRDGGINVQTTTNPPDGNSAFWTGTFLKMRTDPGWWGWMPAATNVLVRQDNGLLIPYDAAGTSSSAVRGWYFTTDNTYNTRTTTPTNFVRVNGPAGEVNANLQFLYQWNMIPTDLYYSSLVGPNYNQPGRHDWDLLDNGIWGQHVSGNELDGINYTPAVSLGRAPVSSAAGADAFVNKVIAYEKYERPDGSNLDADWTKRVVLVSENWGGRIGVSATEVNPPGNNEYHHPSGVNHTIVKLGDTPDWNWSLLARISATDVRLIPYRLDAASAGRGWYFATSSTDLSPNIFHIFLPSGPVIPIPVPSQWVVVYGTPDELAPEYYIWNHTSLDGSLADQEQLRVQLSAGTGFNQRKRLYEDVEDMTPAQLAAGHVEILTRDRLRDALNEGPHIVSLSGHGFWEGCCQLDRSLADGLTNGYHTFIAYADSCLTNMFDADSLSEHILGNPNGGAVAYIGSTRFSWIGAGDDIQRRFFNEWITLGGNAHLGLLFDTRAAFVDSFYWADGRWSVLSLNLMGDPEMPLWFRRPLEFRVPEIYLFDRISLLVDPNPPDPPFRIDQPYIRNWGLTYAHLQQGERERTLLADRDGRVEASMDGFESGGATLTVTRPGHKPIVHQVTLSKSKSAASPLRRRLVASLALIGGAMLALTVHMFHRPKGG